MAVGLGLLRISPADFWSMSIPEFSAATEAAIGPAMQSEPLARDDLTDLMARFPDTKRGKDD